MKKIELLKIVTILATFLAFDYINCADFDENRGGFYHRYFSENIEDVRSAIAAGADLNIEDKYGNTALIHAITNVKPEFIEKYLLDYEKPELTDQGKEFIKAAEDGNFEAITKLLGQGVNINVRDEHGFTALMRAARTNVWQVPPFSPKIQKELAEKQKIVKLLLEQNNINEALRDTLVGRTALEWARTSNAPNKEVIELLENKKRKRKEEETAILNPYPIEELDIYDS